MADDKLRRLDRILRSAERREGRHLPIDHIALDFVISSESVRSGSGRRIVILLGQGKRFGDSIRLGRGTKSRKPRCSGVEREPSALFLAFVGN